MPSSISAIKKKLLDVLVMEVNNGRNGVHYGWTDPRKTNKRARSKPASLPPLWSTSDAYHATQSEDHENSRRKAGITVTFLTKATSRERMRNHL